MNSNIFDLKRFSGYFVYDLKNARNNYGLALLILGCFPVIFYSVWILFNNIWGDHWTAPVFWVRVTVFFLCLAILYISFPASQYGKLTDRRAGADWLLLPASRLEKFLSMLVVSFIAVPLAFLVLYNLTDWILSLCDPTYGQALVSFRINDLIGEEVMIGGESVFRFSGNGFWLIWLSTIASMSVFLLGALCFRRHKIAGTILCEIAFSILFSMIVSMLAVYGSFEGIVEYFDRLDEEDILRHLELKANLALWVPYILVLGSMLTAVWWRLKNLKH